MELRGEYTFDGPREEVWALVRDPEVLGSALPGTQELEQIGENEYAGKMHVRIGPVSGVFAGKIVVSDEVPPESYTLAVEGRGAPGFANGTGKVKLLDAEEGKTLMQYEGEMQVGGRLANVGQRLIDTASKSMVGQGLDSLNNGLKARMKAEEEGVEVEYVPPTEAEFAAAVAKDMADEMLPPPKIVLVVVGVLVAVIVAGFLLLIKLGAEAEEEFEELSLGD